MTLRAIKELNETMDFNTIYWMAAIVWLGGTIVACVVASVIGLVRWLR